MGRPRLNPGVAAWEEPPQITARLSIAQNAWLYREAARRDSSRSEVIRKLVQAQLNKESKPRETF